MRWLVPLLLVSACGDDGAKHLDAAVQLDAPIADVAIDTMTTHTPMGGEALWAKSYGLAGNVSPIATAVDSTGASLYIGYFNDTVNFAGTGASGSEALTANNDSGYLGKLDANGAYVWAKKWSSAAGVYPLAVAIGASDSVFVAGQFLGTTNLGGTDIVSNGQYAAFVGKLDSAGNHVWSKAFGGSTGTQAYASSVSVDSLGNVVVAGYFSGSINFGGGTLTSAGSTDYFVAKLDCTNGSYLWAARYGDTAAQQFIRVAVDKTTNAMNLIGAFAGSVNFGGSTLTASGSQSGFIAQLDTNGQHAWSKLLATASPNRIACDAAGNIYYTGPYTGTVDFSGTGNAGSEVLTASSGTNIFLTKLAASGAHVFSRGFNAPAYLSSDAVGVTSAGVVTIAGQFRNGGPVSFSAGGVTATPLACPAGRAFYAASFTMAGAFRWSTCIGPMSTFQEADALDVDASGHVFVNGSFYDVTTEMVFPKSGGGTITLTKAATTDAFAAKLEP